MSEPMIGRTYHDSIPYWPEPVHAVGRPNVVMIVLDDLGFGSLGCYGSEIATPALDRLAERGVQCTNFHATALCSPTRASLLTGSNHHRVGMAYLSHVDDGYPGYRGRIDHRAPTLAEILRDRGYLTMAVGKWHLAPMDQTTASGPYDQWPLQRGFDRYYGFLEGVTDQFYPELYADNHPIDPPAGPQDGYHLTTDLVDQAITMINDRTAITPEKPFFLYFATGATHTPHQAPEEWVQRYRDAYVRGWDVVRRERFERQLAEGIIPPATELPPPNDGVQDWDDLAPEEQELYARFQEVFAGFLSHTDHEIGRLLDHLERLGRLDDTMVVVVADNGASQEGGPHGVINTTAYENGHTGDLAENLAHTELIDGRHTDVNYPWGWAQAGNTPLKRYKQNTHAGGIRTAMIMKLPGDERAGTRWSHFQHVTDVVPTILDVVDVAAPTERGGVLQLPVDGHSMLPSLRSPGQQPPPRTQYFETVGHRAIWHDGWKAVAYHQRGTDFDTDRWELYHIDNDFSEAHDLAASDPDRLSSLIELWWAEAARNNVLPLDDRGFAQRANNNVTPHSPRDRDTYRYMPGIQHIPTAAAPPVPGRSFVVTARIDRGSVRDHGVLFSHGSVNSGYSLRVDRDGYLVHDLNHYRTHHLVRSEAPVPLGECTVESEFTKDDQGTGGWVTLRVGDMIVGRGRLAETFEYFVAFQGADVGADRLSPVRADPDGTADEFTGGLVEVTVRLPEGVPARPTEPLD